MLRVIVCGSREFTDVEIMSKALLDLREWTAGRPLTLVNGAARGADSLAVELAKQLIPDVVIESHPADWNYYGKVAGPVRNSHMVSLGADLGLAFYVDGIESRGTNNCVNLMRLAGIKVITYTKP